MPYTSLPHRREATKAASCAGTACRHGSSCSARATCSPTSSSTRPPRRSPCSSSPSSGWRSCARSGGGEDDYLPWGALKETIREYKAH